VFSVLGTNADSFVFHGIGPRAVIVFAVVVTFGPPVLMFACEAVLQRWPRVLRAAHVTLIGLLALAAVLHILKMQFGLEGMPQLAVALALSASALALVARYRAVDAWLRLLSMLSLAALLLFLFDSPAGRYARAASTAAYRIEAGRTPVIFVMLDELPTQSLLGSDGSIDTVRFPNFARLARISTWYRNYSTRAEVTQFAVPVAVSGRNPEFSRNSNYADYPDTLFAWLGHSYKMNVSELVTKLCAPAICSDENSVVGSQPSGNTADWSGMFRDIGLVYAQMIDLTITNEFDAFTENFRQRPLPSGVQAIVTDRAHSIVAGSRFPTAAESMEVTASETGRWRNWLERVGATPGPALNYIHLLLPHQPWVFYPDGTVYTTLESETTTEESDWENKVRRQRHILQVQYLDRLIGELLAKMASSPLLRDSVLVVVADHGIAFTTGYPRRYISGDYKSYPELMYPPLFVHASGQDEGRISDVNVESVDVLPLLSAELNISLPWPVDGMLPQRKEGARATEKRMFLYMPPNPFGMQPRPDKELAIQSQDGLEKMLAGAMRSERADDYLSPLYSGTPFDALRGRAVGTFAIAESGSRARLDPDLRATRPLLLLRGSVSGDVASGDWLALVVNGKVSGLSQVNPRRGELRFTGLLRREDYVDDAEQPAIYRIGGSGTVLGKIHIE
jgi:hypothetical protein